MNLSPGFSVKRDGWSVRGVAKDGHIDIYFDKIGTITGAAVGYLYEALDFAHMCSHLNGCDFFFQQGDLIRMLYEFGAIRSLFGYGGNISRSINLLAVGFLASLDCGSEGKALSSEGNYDRYRFLGHTVANETLLGLQRMPGQQPGSEDLRRWEFTEEPEPDGNTLQINRIGDVAYENARMLHDAFERRPQTTIVMLETVWRKRVQVATWFRGARNFLSYWENPRGDIPPAGTLIYAHLAIWFTLLSDPDAEFDKMFLNGTFRYIFKNMKRPAEDSQMNAPIEDPDVLSQGIYTLFGITDRSRPIAEADRLFGWDEDTMRRKLGAQFPGLHVSVVDFITTAVFQRDSSYAQLENDLTILSMFWDCVDFIYKPNVINNDALNRLGETMTGLGLPLPETELQEITAEIENRGMNREGLFRRLVGRFTQVPSQPGQKPEAAASAETPPSQAVASAPPVAASPGAVPAIDPDERMREYGLHRVHARGDGNCFFNAALIAMFTRPGEPIPRGLDHLEGVVKCPPL
jgi:hypothetical protein